MTKAIKCLIFIVALAALPVAAQTLVAPMVTRVVPVIGPAGLAGYEAGVCIGGFDPASPFSLNMTFLDNGVRKFIGTYDQATWTSGPNFTFDNFPDGSHVTYITGTMSGTFTPYK